MLHVWCLRAALLLLFFPGAAPVLLAGGASGNVKWLGWYHNAPQETHTFSNIAFQVQNATQAIEQYNSYGQPSLINLEVKLWCKGNCSDLLPPAAASAAVATRQAGTSATAESRSATCSSTVANTVLGYGSNLHAGPTTAKTVGECCSRCSKDPKCRSYSWEGSTARACWLHTSVGPTHHEIGTTSGVPDGPVPQPGSCALDATPNRDCPDSDLANGTRGKLSPAACCAACKAASGCNAWVVTGQSDKGTAQAGICYLKKDCNGLVETMDGVAGLANGTLPHPKPRHWTGWRLRPDHESYIKGLAALYGPLLSNGTVLGFNLGDELCAKGLPQSNLSAGAKAMRKAFPRGSAILWYNEDSGAPRKPGYRVPPEMDWYSIDLYDMRYDRKNALVYNTKLQFWMFSFETSALFNQTARDKRSG
eukprot:COSAG06_NODE_1009_length_11087_cov_48.043866_3_plen_421_part_00